MLLIERIVEIQVQRWHHSSAENRANQCCQHIDGNISHDKTAPSKLHPHRQQSTQSKETQ